MTSSSDVERIMRQTRQYEYSDGLRDLQLAIVLGIGGVVTWLVLQPIWIMGIAKLAQKYGRGAAWLGLLAIFLAPLAAWGMVALMNFVRRRWLWRQSGMVKPTRWVVSRRVNVLSAVILITGLAFGIAAYRAGWVEDTFILRMLWAATGWSFGFTLVGMGSEIRLSRYIWLGLIGGAFSTVLLFLQLRFSQIALVFGLSWGLLLTASGIFTLRQAIRAARVSQ